MKTTEEMKALLSSAINVQFTLRLMSDNLKMHLEMFPELKKVHLRTSIEKLPDYTLETLQNAMADVVNILTITFDEMGNLLNKESE